MLPPEATHVDSEAELAVEIGRGGRRIAEDDALDFVAGYRCANDVSARNLQYGDKQWTRGKGFDTFCPLGDRLVPVSELGDGSGLRVVQRLNGELLQDGNTSDLVFGVPPARRVRLGGLHARAGRPDPDRARRPASATRARRRSRCGTATSSRSRSTGSACLRNPVVAELRAR